MECKKIVNIALPAVRMSLARKLSQAGLKQQEIASLLGVAQAEISKYLNGVRISSKIREVAGYIDANGLDKEILEKLKKKEEASKEIDALCERLVMEKVV